MAIIENWLPPSRENYDFIMSIWMWLPLAASMQWLTSWYGMGKTSVQSRFNIPGRIAWTTMESPGFMTLLYVMNTLPAQHGISDLPWQNKVLGALFVLHYIYRAVLFPIIQPSMSPVHIFMWLSALSFQVTNGACIGSWLAAYGPTSQEEWAAQNFSVLQFAVGLAVFYIGLTSNYFADEELREIRRRKQQRQGKLAAEGKRGIEKHYSVPQNGLFQYMLYPHYFMEWIEWLGFWIAGGWAFLPARCFFLNEVFAMFPRAVSGGKWYRETFGEENVKGKWVIIPGIY